MEEMSEIDELIEILRSARLDYYKTYNKNVKAASIRLRRKLEEVSKKCREIRNDVLDYRKETIDPKNKEIYNPNNDINGY
jgi:vacuolar-type H+-ATPase subunit H